MLTPRQWKKLYGDCPMTLRAIHRKAPNVRTYHKWMDGFVGFGKKKDRNKGFRLSENPNYGGVHPTIHSGSAAEKGPSNHYAHPNATADWNYGPPGTSDKEVTMLTRWERLCKKFTPVTELYFKDKEGFNAHPTVDPSHRTHGHSSHWVRPNEWGAWRRQMGIR